MGGPGSGRRWHYGARYTTDDYPALDVRRLSREKLLVAGNSFVRSWYRGGAKVASIRIEVAESWIVLDYRSRQYGETDWRHNRYSVVLDRTPCHLGGVRHWFRCPGEGCGRRVAILYGGERYVCRHCHQLAYESQREVDYDRLARRADRIRDKLGWERGILNGNYWPKPKGMHWRTFQRLVAEHDRLVAASLQGIAAQLSLSGEPIEDWMP
ncbi:MAG: hypothetical protein CME40_05830 [Haliea sp.]|nr:hypothetical protein [Haliea sp.]|tara:strand:+ start:6350 stop:6982 length:633 start_codon:yes stop_codon:yes gene_type:complete